jgi:predicted Zn-dependent protease
MWDFEAARLAHGPLPLDDDDLVLRTAIWRLTDEAAREARERILKVRGEERVLVAETDPSDDFAAPAVHVDLRAATLPPFDPRPWEALAPELSAVVDHGGWVERSSVTVSIAQGTRWIVTSEGTRIREPWRHARVAIAASARAADGMDVDLYRWKDVADPSALPDRPTLLAWAATTREDLGKLLAAPVGEPYAGPVLLRGRAAGVFVHEVIGHRVEGHRQKKEDEGRTFRELVGDRVLPPEISIVDDPTLATYGGFDLNGHYAYDDQGIPAARATIVDHGVFRGFLMARSPIRDFPDSNGHGRAQAGRRPVPRMANTILQTSAPRPYDDLRRQLIAEAKRQGLPYGVIVDELAGGFTLTGRVEPNAFNIRAGTSWRVYVDGRPDELIRGIDLVGTPLTVLAQVVAAGDDPDVFNGYCGAESGAVPNAAVAPSLLIRKLEMQLKEKGQQRPPLLPRPDAPPKEG